MQLQGAKFYKSWIRAVYFRMP